MLPWSGAKPSPIEFSIWVLQVAERRRTELLKQEPSLALSNFGHGSCQLHGEQQLN